MAKAKKFEDSPKIYEAPSIGKTAKNLESVEAMTPETDRMVTGIFRNIECPGQPARVCMRLYKGMAIFNQVLEDGILYTIPLSVAKGIKQYCAHIKHDHLLGDNGKHLKINNPFNRYEFVAAEFR
jgi:hypothetical protein